MQVMDVRIPGDKASSFNCEPKSYGLYVTTKAFFFAFTLLLLGRPAFGQKELVKY